MVETPILTYKRVVEHFQNDPDSLFTLPEKHDNPRHELEDRDYCIEHRINLITLIQGILESLDTPDTIEGILDSIRSHIQTWSLMDEWIDISITFLTFRMEVAEIDRELCSNLIRKYRSVFDSKPPQNFSNSFEL